MTDSIKQNTFYIITGGPGVGKTSLIEELQERGMAIVPEIARELIKEQQAVDGEALPWKNRTLYRDLMFERSIASFEQTINDHQGAGAVFFDRGFLDTLCYSTLEGIMVNDTMKTYAKNWRYNDHVFLLPPWKEIYQTDDQRKQGWDEAVLTHHKMIQTYQGFGYEVVELPKTSVSERAGFIIDFIK